MKHWIGIKEVKRKRSEQRQVKKGTLRNLDLGFEELGMSESMLVCILHMLSNRCQDRIKHARILLGEMVMWEKIRRNLGKVKRGYKFEWKRKRRFHGSGSVPACHALWGRLGLVGPLMSLWVKVGCQKWPHVSPKWAYLTSALVSHWLGAAYGVCGFTQFGSGFQDIAA